MCLLILTVLCCAVVFPTAAQSPVNSVTGTEDQSANHSASKTGDDTADKECLSFFQQNRDCLPVVTVTALKNNICSGTAVAFHAAVANDGTNGVYKWKRNNQNAGVANSADCTFADFRDGDVVSCEYSCHTTCGADATVQSNAVTVKVADDFAPGVTVLNTDSLICEGQLTTFTADAFYGDGIPSYQWTVNGAPVGTNSATFTTNTITNGSKVKCLLTVNVPACPAFNRSASSQLTIYVYPLVHPAITIQPSNTDICRGEAVTFNAKANGGAYPAFTWLVNGVQTGPNSPSLSTSSLKDGDKITCTVTIEQDSRCHESTTSAGSNEVIVHVRDYPEPAVDIASPNADVCAGNSVFFTSVAENIAPTAAYQWRVNGAKKGNDSPSFDYNQFANGDKVYCLLTTSIPGCSISRTVSSDTIVVTVRVIPVVQFSPPQVAVMAGEAAHLTPSVSDSAVSFTWVPASLLLDSQSLAPVTLPLTQDTTVRLDVVNRYGCMASGNLLIKVLRPLYMPSAFTPNGDGKNDEFRIPPASSIELRRFSVFDRWGNLVFTTSDLAKGWDGIYKGSLASADTYVYLIKGRIIDREVTIKGTVTLVR